MLDAMISWTADLAHHVVALAPVPKPDESTAPPGADKFQILLGWAKWGAFFCCVAGFMLVGARMGIQHKRGEGGGHIASLAIVSFACAIIGSAVLIVEKFAAV
ncbi:hypothetical protein HUT06_05330 [Actinomadura sp. NAK00032]|uniref:hypothetical protein n=1 Tax=Actinomadura sp. NAK00032 TaxID=2742128 RepID=UPI0015907245|nr:hypothetical protein [Actinomadura sp. NAK00032]QKW33523.1 hypothetical protein HUT06_05330 [Actinomadura sp. NAK00032]